MLQPERAIAELRELRELTEDEHGAQRVCWTPVWAESRRWLEGKLAELPVDVEVDAAGNMWATLPGERDGAVVLGSHLDSVPDGGWLDGALGVVAGLEVVRWVAAQGRPPVSVRLVDFADEEGTRFGRSLWGSSCVSGNIDLDEVAALRDDEGRRLDEVLAEHGVDVARAKDAGRQIADARAYLELHCEQGPILEQRGLPVAAVLGMYGVDRNALRFTGRSAHESWPWASRRDAFAAAARVALRYRDLARERGGFATVGSVVTRPGFVTAIAGECDMTADHRHFEPEVLAAMRSDARRFVDEICAEERVDVEWTRLWEIPPTRFHPDLVAFAEAAVEEVCGASLAIPSGPLHDAAEMARAGVPSAMLFVQSLDGISHSKDEDSRPEHIALAIEALDRLASRTIAWVAEQ